MYSWGRDSVGRADFTKETKEFESAPHAQLDWVETPLDLRPNPIITCGGSLNTVK